MRFEVLYPNGKTKALTFSYDDGEIHDRRLVEIFNRYGMKATFHLNSGKFNTPGYIEESEVLSLYQGHEVACHGVEHKYLGHLPKEQLVKEVWEDRKELERITGRIVNGMSYAFGEYSDSIIDTIECLGIKYSRTVNSTHGFHIPDNFMRWNPTCHHSDDIVNRADQFLNSPDYMKLPLFYIWGHSFEFGRQNNWEIIEEFCQKVAGKEDIWYVTNIDYRNYVMAVRSLVLNTENSRVYNPSGLPIWLKCNNQTYEIEPGKTVDLA
ncbi:MAG TPA: polysaccharide deacetylase family protein [Mobilitalea sp.]|nr:polysaccharide deacetylase family protein [Mobilitalea sp.]